MNWAEIKEFVKKHWIWIALAAGILAVFLMTRSRTTGASGQAGLTPAQQASIAQGNTQAQVAEDQLAAQSQAAQLGAQTQVQLAQINAASQANAIAAASNADQARTAAALAAVQGQQAVQNNSVAAASSAYNQQAILSALPNIAKIFTGGGSAGSGTVIPSSNAPGGSFVSTPTVIPSETDLQPADVIGGGGFG